MIVSCHFVVHVAVPATRPSGLKVIDDDVFDGLPNLVELLVSRQTVLSQRLVARDWTHALRNLTFLFVVH